MAEACGGLVTAMLGWKRMLPFLHGDVKSLKTLVSIGINGTSLPRKALGEEDSSLNATGMDLGSTLQLC